MTTSPKVILYGQEVPSQLALLLLREKHQALLKGILIPDDFIAELDSFCSRNSIVSLKRLPRGSSRLSSCCPNCLKAFALQKADEMLLGDFAYQFINKLIHGETGHDGYYLDNEELKKQDSSF